MLVMIPLTHLQRRASKPWLVGLDSQQLVALTTQRLQELTHLQLVTPFPTVLLTEAEPANFLAGFIAACTLHCPIFLGNPDWADLEWQQALATAQPDLIWGAQPKPILALSPPSKCNIPPARPGWIMIPTGGSSGQIRFAIHTWQTLTAAVAGFQAYFQVEQVNTCCVLPLYHVSGLMQFLRSFVSGGKLILLPFKALESRLDEFEPADFFLSLVPTQLQRWLHPSTNLASIEKLAQFHTIFLGGAPAWTTLLTAARQQQIRLAPTYGMTETAAQVATLKPDQFLQGISGVGQPLPHAHLQIRAPIMNPTEGEATLQTGTIVIQSSSLMLGYFPDAVPLTEFETDDIGVWDRQGSLQVVGRNSQKIITGGENVFPAEIESAIRSTGWVSDVCVVGMPDQTWGEVVTAIYVPGSPKFSLTALQAAISPRLSKFKRPKQWIEVERLPRNRQGKVNYELLKQTL